MTISEKQGVPRVVAVLGAGGFIGRALVARLVAEGHVVRAGAPDPRRLMRLTRFKGPGRVELVRADVLSPEGLERLFDGAEAGVNLVSIMDVDRARMRRINVQGAECAARAARDAEVTRYVHISAIGASLTSPGAYGRSKGQAEYAVRAVFPDAGLLRPSVVFGRHDSFLNLFALIAKLSPVLPVFCGRTRYQPVFVEDVVSAIMAMLGAAGQGQIVEAGGPDVLTMRGLMSFILEATHRRRILLPIPQSVARIQGAVFEKLPGQLLTRDQVAMMGVDNIVDHDAVTLAALGIAARSLRQVAPACLNGSILKSWKQLSRR